MGNSLVRVLLVDDDEDDYIITSDLLSEIEATDFELDWVATYDAALAAFEQQCHDVYLVDYRLGQRDGLQLLNQVIANGCTAPVILLTGQGDHEVDVQAMKAGASDFLVKGQFEAPLLERSIRYAIERARTLETLRRNEERFRRRNRELALLNQLIAASATELDPVAILEMACRELALAFDVASVNAFLLNEEKTHIVIVAEHMTEDWMPTLHEQVPVESNPAAQYLLTTNGPLAVPDAQNDPRLAPVRDMLRQRGVSSMLVLPLTIEDVVVGGLSLQTKTPYSFSAEELSLAWSAAEQVAGALARARLTQTHQRLITAVEQTADSVAVTDAEGTILYVNPAFERVTGYSQAEVLGQTPHLLRSGKQEAAFYQDLWGTISTGKVWHGRFVNRKKDGALYTADATITPVRNGNSEIVNFVWVSRDVTRELQLEEQYRQAQKMEAIGRLTGGIAHDFNNLLTAIDGFAELAQFQVPPEDPVQELIIKARQSSRRAIELVRQLLAFSRKQIIESKVLDLNEVVSEMDRMLRRIISEDIVLETILAPGLWSAKIDPTQIEQVIINLAVNARDAMPNGGKLIIETKNVVLDDDFAAHHLDIQPGEHVLLAVSDTGTGISEEVRARIFEPFFTTKEKGKGTGLGLATAYGIVKQSKGDIQCYSEVGVGTTFKIYLPRVYEAAQPLSCPKDERHMPSGGETILLVEDNDEVRELARHVLQTQGYILVEARSGHEALQLIGSSSDPIHLLLTDVIMPEMNGVDLARQLADTHVDTKILFMSGYTDETLEPHGVLEPDVAFLQKPFSPLVLARKVRAVLDA